MTRKRQKDYGSGSPKRLAATEKGKDTKRNWSPEQRQQWRDKLRACNLGIDVSELAAYDNAQLQPRHCPVCQTMFVPTGGQRSRLRYDKSYAPCCTVRCTYIHREQLMTPEQKAARRETRRRTATAVHAARSPEERSAIIKKAHAGRDYNKLRATWQKKSPQEVSAIFKKRVATAKARGNYTVSSSWEDRAHDLLTQAFTRVETQYADERYPYPCDFYLPDYDTFIELHGFWVHGREPYDDKNPEHVKRVRKWRAKKQTMYNAAVKAWTIRDPSKVETAKANRLNLLRFYTLEDLEYWINLVTRPRKLQPSPLSGRWFTHLSKINAGRIVKHFQFAEFHKQELAAWRKKSVRVKLYANRQTWVRKNPQELTDQNVLTGLNLAGLAKGYSSFDPVWLTDFVATTSCTHVYDPTGGWGHRMLAAASSGVDYTYNDVNPRTVAGVCAIRDWLADKTEAVLRVGNYDAAKVSCKSLRRLSPDAVFTCPPYHNAEVYSDEGAEHLTREQFDLWWQRVVHTFPHTVKHVGLVVPSKMLETFSYGLNVISITELHRRSVFRTDKLRSREVLIYGTINFK